MAAPDTPRIASIVAFALAEARKITSQAASVAGVGSRLALDKVSVLSRSISLELQRRFGCSERASNTIAVSSLALTAAGAAYALYQTFQGSDSVVHHEDVDRLEATTKPRSVTVELITCVSDFFAGASDELLIEFFRHLQRPRATLPRTDALTDLLNRFNSIQPPPLRAILGLPDSEVSTEVLIPGSVCGQARCKCGKLSMQLQSLTTPLSCVSWPRLARGKPLVMLPTHHVALSEDTLHHCLRTRIPVTDAALPTCTTSVALDAHAVSQVVALSCADCSGTPLYLLELNVKSASQHDNTATTTTAAARLSTSPGEEEALRCESFDGSVSTQPCSRVYAVQLASCSEWRGHYDTAAHGNVTKTTARANVYPFAGVAVAGMERRNTSWRARDLGRLISAAEVDVETRAAAKRIRPTRRQPKHPRSQSALPDVSRGFATPAAVQPRERFVEHSFGRVPSSGPSHASSERPHSAITSASSPYSVGSSISSHQSNSNPWSSLASAAYDGGSRLVAELVPNRGGRSRGEWAARYRVSSDHISAFSNGTPPHDARSGFSEERPQSTSTADYYGYLPGSLSSNGAAVALSSPVTPKSQHSTDTDRERFLAAGLVSYDEISSGRRQVVQGASKGVVEPKEPLKGLHQLPVHATPASQPVVIPKDLSTIGRGHPHSLLAEDLSAPPRRVKATAEGPKHQTLHLDHQTSPAEQPPKSSESSLRFHSDGEAGGTGAGPSDMLNGVRSAGMLSATVAPHLPQMHADSKPLPTSYAGLFRHDASAAPSQEFLSFAGLNLAGRDAADSPSSNATTLSFTSRATNRSNHRQQRTRLSGQLEDPEPTSAQPIPVARA